LGSGSAWYVKAETIAAKAKKANGNKNLLFIFNQI
jgi:hypothetical protein